MPLSPPSWTFYLHDAPAKPIVFQILPSGTRYRSIRARSDRLLNSFVPQAVRALNSTHPAPLWNPMQTPNLLKHGPSTPLTTKHTPTLLQTLKLFVQFEVCYTQVSGPVQTTCSNTLSSIRTRHFSHITMCTKSHKKTQHYMYVYCTCTCTTNHCSPASCLTHDVSLSTCTVFIWSIRTVCIVSIFFYSMYRLTFTYSVFIVKICQ